MKHADFLVEIGTEELPPKALRSLMNAFGEGLADALGNAHLEHGDVHAYASPRRLAVLVEGLAFGQDDRQVTKKGPPVKVAFDADGNAQPPATAFAKKCGVAVADLGRTSTDKGEWLSCELVEKGSATADLLPELVEKALAGLPIPRRMRWGDGEAEFVRPVHWVLMLHGSKLVPGLVLGVTSDKKTRGHRFHAPKPITIKSPGDYLRTLEEQGHVFADFERRRDLVIAGVTKAAKKAGGKVVDGESLYDEVTSLVEWPVPVLGSFDDEYLELPREVVISTLTGHQRYFPISNKKGALLPKFVTVANLESSDIAQVRNGNERVIRPRLADAAFFWDTDRRQTLASRENLLREVVYQQGLGSLHDKSARTANIGALIAAPLGEDAESVRRAATIAKCDLLTGLVGEFPDLQGTMGQYYALSDGENDAVATALGEQYLPRFSGDLLPTTGVGRVLAIADKLDTLAGVFALGKKPTGNRDPFGLRRAAVGLIRIVVECGLDLDLKALIHEAVSLQPDTKADKDALVTELYSFIAERLRRYFLDRDERLATETFDAVLVNEPASLTDFARRLDAVQSFLALDEAASLSAANKRIANILRQADLAETRPINAKLLEEPAEIALNDALDSVTTRVQPLLEKRQYTEAMRELAGLRQPVDSFFDDVMVMDENEALRDNRLALLGALRALFLGVADVSRLSIA